MWVRDEDNFMDKYFDPSGIRYQPPGDRFEIDHLERAMGFVTGFRTAIDGGAHYGSWTRHMAGRFEQVMAFEPVLETFKCLIKNTFEYTDVAVFLAALGSGVGVAKMGRGQLYHHPGMETVLTASVTEELDDSLPESYVRMLSVDALAFTDLDLLKLDIEGYELRALQGAENTLKRCRPVVIFEENIRGALEYGIPEGSCGGFLTNLGASLVARIGSDHVYAWR